MSDVDALRAWLAPDAQEPPCRGMALLPGIGFVSASHDHTLRVWDEGGALLAELVCLF